MRRRDQVGAQPEPLTRAPTGLRHLSLAWPTFVIDDDELEAALAGAAALAREIQAEDSGLEELEVRSYIDGPSTSEHVMVINIEIGLCILRIPHATLVNSNKHIETIRRSTYPRWARSARFWRSWGEIPGSGRSACQAFSERPACPSCT